MSFVSCGADPNDIAWLKSHVALYFDYLDLRILMVPLMTHQHHMTPMPVIRAKHEQKGHVAPHFNCLDVRNAMVPLLMPLVTWCQDKWHLGMLTLMPVMSHDQKSYVASNFSCLDLWNAIMPLMILLASCDTNATGITWPNKSCCTSFWSSWCKKFSGAIIDAVSIMCC